MTIASLKCSWKCAAAGSGLMAMLVALVVSAGFIKEGCADTASMPTDSSLPAVVTADIQAGIVRHIEEQVRVGGGYYRLQFKDRELRLKLVRIHTEYLANLGPHRHFACVDLADISGDVYDVDFFMSGDAGSMTVTETTVHKINGQTYYAWEQKKDKTWHRIPIERASEGHFGVIRGRDNFEFFSRVLYLLSYLGRNDLHAFSKRPILYSMQQTVVKKCRSAAQGFYDDFRRVKMPTTINPTATRAAIKITMPVAFPPAKGEVASGTGRVAGGMAPGPRSFQLQEMVKKLQWGAV